MIIEVNVSNKIARLADKNTVAVCENSDYVIHFNFDEEWAAYETKTARFKWGGKYTDVVFTGNECAMPVINNVYSVKIGVYAGNLHTTTSALLMMKKSILCGNEPEHSASQEVRNKFLDVLDKRTGDLSALQTTAKDNLVAAINEAAASGGADWNQNDPTAKDYVKNRTHYTEIVETSSGVGANGFMTGYMNATDPPSTFSKVTISGNTYRDVGVTSNGRYLTASVGNYALSFDQVYNNLSVSPSDANANDFEFFIKKEETHTIPDEYIPDWVMNKADAAQPDWNKYYETDKGRVKNRPNIYMMPGTLENTTIGGDSPSITPAAIFIFYGDFTGKIRTRRISMQYSGETLTRDIVNPYTDNAITDDDCPDGAMIVRCNFDVARKPIFRCVNPIIKDYFTSTDALPQHEMSAVPTKDMEIAVKKYVDDKECILQSTTPGSIKKFKITVDDSGTLSAVEVTE